MRSNSNVVNRRKLLRLTLRAGTLTQKYLAVNKIIDLPADGVAGNVVVKLKCRDEAGSKYLSVGSGAAQSHLRTENVSTGWGCGLWGSRRGLPLVVEKPVA